MSVLSVGRRTGEAAVNISDVLGLDLPGPMARAHQMARGAWDPERDPSLRGRQVPLLIVDGAVLQFVALRGREGADLLGPGDLVPTETNGDVFSTRRRVLMSGSFVALDQRVLAAAAGEPALTVALAEAAARRAGALAGQVVLAQLVAIDDRLRILLPSLAERWGKVTADGVVLPSFLSHTVLSALVGARRPSLTAAVGRLVEDGTVRRLPDRRWLLPHGLDGLG
jgi:CRP-like cAMP-binding protein